MLTKRIRKQIEWHFYNYAADKELYEERVAEIAESGVVANYSAIGGHSPPGNPTERKGLLINELSAECSWATVVRNTFIAFRFEPEFKVMVELYINGRPRDELLCGGLWESTFYRWRDNWLEFAYKWAKKFNLLS